MEERNPAGVQYELVDYQPANRNISSVILSQRELAGDYVLRFPQALRVCRAPPSWVFQRWEIRALPLLNPAALIHRGWGYYLLEKVDGRWKIISKSVGHFF